MTAPTELRTSVIRLQGHRITVRRTALRPEAPVPPATPPVPGAPAVPAASSVPSAPAPSRPTDHLEP